MFSFEGNSAAMGLGGAVIVLLGLFSTVFWMVVGWRAMRAHEDLARSARKLAGKSRQRDELD